MARCRIARVYAKNNIPISENAQLINARAPIWDVSFRDKPNGYKPAIFLLRNQDEICLEFILQIDPSLVDSEFDLRGFYFNSKEKFKEMFQTKSVDRHNHGSENISIELKLSKKIESFILVSGKYLQWKLTINGREEEMDEDKIEMELYWIFDFSKEHFPRGVPLEVIRELSVACHANWRISSNDVRNGVIRADPKVKNLGHIQWALYSTTQHVFFRNPPRYDVADKNETQFYKSAKNNQTRGGAYLDAMYFKLREFLDAKNDPIATCECTDQAVVLQYYLRCLGFTEIMLGFIEGPLYLQITGLVGRGCTNNPRYEDVRARPIVGGICKKRSCFAYHVFCFEKKGKKILDSCIGPYTGEKGYREYCEKMFSPCSNYPTKPFYRKGVIAVDRLVRAKKLKVDTEFIENLGYEMFWKKNYSPFHVDPDPQTEFIECAWSTFEKYELFTLGGWNLFCENIMPGYGEAEKVWKFNRNLERIEIRISTSKVDGETSYQRFLHNISEPSWTQCEWYPNSAEQKKDGFPDHYLIFVDSENRKKYEINGLNVTITVKCYNHTVSFDNFVEELLELARSNKKKCEDGPEFLPLKPKFSMNEINSSNVSLKDQSQIEMKLGDRLIVSSGGCESLLMDFYIELKDPDKEAKDPFAPKGLQLIEEEFGKLVFEAVHVVDERILTVTAINEETLLGNTNSITFKVVKESKSATH